MVHQRPQLVGTGHRRAGVAVVMPVDRDPRDRDMRDRGESVVFEVRLLHDGAGFLRVALGLEPRAPSGIEQGELRLCHELGVDRAGSHGQVLRRLKVGSSIVDRTKERPGDAAHEGRV